MEKAASKAELEIPSKVYASATLVEILLLLWAVISIMS